MSEIARSSADRDQRTEFERHGIARQYSEHLPTCGVISVSDEDAMAMKAAFIARFDEDLPRTETLFKVAAIGYRMALRDLAEKA